jgi:hypothetical protein
MLGTQEMAEVEKVIEKQSVLKFAILLEIKPNSKKLKKMLRNL